MKCQSFPSVAAVFALTLTWGLISSHAADEAVLAAYSLSPWVFLTSTLVMIRPCYGMGLSFMMRCIGG